MPTEARSRGKGWWKRAVKLLVTAALIAGILRFIPLSEILAVLRDVRLDLVAIGFAVYMSSVVLQAVQLRLLLRRLGMPQGTGEIFEINMVTRFYGQFLPSELMAGALKLYRLAGPEKQWGETLAALAFFRFVNLLVLIAMGVVFWALDMPTGPGRWVGLVMGAMGVAVLVAHQVLSHPTLSDVARRLLPERGFRWLRGKLVEKFRELAAVTLRSYRLFRGMVSVIAGMAVLRHVLGILYFSLYAQSLGVQLSFLTIGWIRVVLQFVVMLPISFSGLGVREGSLVVLLQEYGVSPGQAVALSFVLFATGLLGNALGGFFELKNVLWGTGWRDVDVDDPGEREPGRTIADEGSA